MSENGCEAAGTRCRGFTLTPARFFLGNTVVGFEKLLEYLCSEVSHQVGVLKTKRLGILELQNQNTLETYWANCLYAINLTHTLVAYIDIHPLSCRDCRGQLN